MSEAPESPKRPGDTEETAAPDTSAPSATALGTPSPTGVWKWIPGLQVARGYRLGYLRHDVVAGLILTALLVPAGMGYAEASGLPPIYGLYATIVPLVAYAVFGPSRILVLGPDSALAALIAAVVLPLSGGDTTQAVAIAGTLGIFVGLICVAAGLARFGFITDLLSKPVRYGYINGIALTVLVSQLPKLFGFSVSAENLLPQIKGFVQGLASGKTNPTALAIGLSSLAIILVLKRWAPKVPGVLVAVVLATVAVGALDLTAKGISVVGALPQGLPSFTIPPLHVADMATLLAGAFGIALVAFADTSVLSRTFAIRGGYKVDPNHELMALGVANAAAGLFQGFPISSSASRTPVAESAGAKTQVTGLVGAGAIALLLVFAPSLLRNVPSAALAAVVIAASLSLVDVAGVSRLFRQRRSEFWLSMASFLGVALLGVLYGIGVAVGLSLLNFIRRAWSPHDAVLGRVDGLKGYHDIGRHPEGKQIPGLVIFRFDAPLFFANAETFGERVRELAGTAEPPARWVIVAAEPITDIDSTAADMLVELESDLEAAGVELAFAELKGHVRDRLGSYGLTDRIGRQLFFPTIGVAVHTYLASTGVEWTDWEDEAKPSADGAVEAADTGDSEKPTPV